MFLGEDTVNLEDGHGKRRATCLLADRGVGRDLWRMQRKPRGGDVRERELPTYPAFSTLPSTIILLGRTNSFLPRVSNVGANTMSTTLCVMCLTLLG
jgi:hypothetical protein